MSKKLGGTKLASPRGKGPNAKGLQAKLIKGNKSVKGRRISFRLYYKFGTDRTRNVYRDHRVVLKAAANCRLSARQIETGRRLIKRLVSRKLNVLVRVYPFAPVTKRPHDVRMGKGKGMRITDWICPIKAGKILYEIAPPALVNGCVTVSASRFSFDLSLLRILASLRKKLSLKVNATILEL